MSADIDATENEGQHDNWVIRVDAAGTILWERSFGFSGHDHAYKLLQRRMEACCSMGFLM